MKTNTIHPKKWSWNTGLMQRYGFASLRYSLAVIFIWFGILKPFGASPAAELVANTVFWFSPDWFVPLLGWWEVAIGISFLLRKTVRLGIIMLFLQMPGTFLPLILLPEVTFTHFPYGLALEGQYIVKNLTLISAAITIGGACSKEN